MKSVFGELELVMKANDRSTKTHIEKSQTRTKKDDAKDAMV